MKSRIFVDSCVLISASVFVSSKIINETAPIKHFFYEECRDLFTFIDKNGGKNLGVTTVTVENESIDVLETVIEGELKRRGFSRIDDFDIFSRVLNISTIKLSK